MARVERSARAFFYRYACRLRIDKSVQLATRLAPIQALRADNSQFNQT